MADGNDADQSIGEQIDKTEKETLEIEPAVESPAAKSVSDEQPSSSTPTAVNSPVSNVPDIRLRIGNAVKAIKNLGGQVESIDLNKMTDEELHMELEELTTQYKRLKNSQTKKQATK